MATSQNQEPVTNGFHDGESLNERIKKYKIDDDEDKTGGNPAEQLNQPLFKDEAERIKHLHKIRASPTSSAASRISKNRTRNYEVLGPLDGMNTYASLSNGAPLATPTVPARAPIFMDPTSLVIPKDGNLQGFSVDEMAAFFRYMRVSEEIVQRLHRKELDGRKFAKLKDKTLEDLQIKNPIILHFRDRSNKGRTSFML